jgi:hypothetical protein
MLEFYHNLEIPYTPEPAQLTLISDFERTVRVYSYPDGLQDELIHLDDGKTSFYYGTKPGGWVIIAEGDGEEARMNLMVAEES